METLHKGGEPLVLLALGRKFILEGDGGGFYRLRAAQGMGPGRGGSGGVDKLEQLRICLKQRKGSTVHIDRGDIRTHQRPSYGDASLGQLRGGLTKEQTQLQRGGAA